MERAQVLDVVIQDQLRKYLSLFKPRPSIYDPDFIAANQVRNTLPQSHNPLLYTMLFNVIAICYGREHVRTIWSKALDTNSLSKFERIFGKLRLNKYIWVPP